MQVGPAEALGVRARLRDDLHADALVVLIDSQPLWVRLSSPPRPRARPHTTSASRIGHCIVQFRSISCCSLRVDSTALLWFSRIVSNIVHVLGPASSSHSPILTVSTRRFKQKMLRVQNTRYLGRFPGFVRDSAIDFGVRMLHMHNVRRAGGSATGDDSRCRKKVAAPNRWSRLEQVPRTPWDDVAPETAAISDGGPQNARRRRAGFGKMSAESQRFPLNLSCERKTICNMLFGNLLWQQTRSSYCTLSMLLVL